MSGVRSAFFSALTLAERTVTPPPRADAPSDELRAWQAVKAFAGAPERWAERLRQARLDEAELAGLLAESDEALAQRVSPPAWLRALDAALGDLAPYAPVWEETIARVPGNHQRGCLRLVAPFARAVVTALDSALARAEAGGVPLDRSRLLASLLAHLPLLVEAPLTQTLALEVQVARARGLLEGETPAARFDYFIAAIADPDVLPSFWERHPVLARTVSGMLARYAAACEELLLRLAGDWNALAGGLVAATAGPLVAIVHHTTETHCGGRIVAILHFSSGARLVYKPRSGAADLGYSAALAWLAARLPDRAIPRAPRVLSRELHSFHEFIEAAPCRTRAELARYYERQGVHVALLYALVASDMHAGNMIASGEQPVLVDVEALLQPRPLPARFDPNPAGEAMLSSVLGTLFLPAKVFGAADAPGVDISALGSRSGQRTAFRGVVMKELGTDEARAAYELADIESLGQRPELDGIEVDPGEWVDAVVRGFTGAWEALAAAREDFIRGPLAALREAPVRVLSRSTDVYATLLRSSHRPDRLTDGLARERLFDFLYGATATVPELGRLVASERADLHQGDVPYFWMRPSERDLLDSRGHVIEGLYAVAPFEVAVRRVRELDEAALVREVWMIRASFATLTPGEGPPAWAPSNTSLPPVPVDRDGLIERARRIGERLRELAIRDGDCVGWLGLHLVRERDCEVAPARADLYGGAPGIALFLAQLGAITQDRRFTVLAEDAVATTLPHLEAKLLEGEPLDLGIGGDTSGAVFAFAHLASLLRRGELLDRAEQIARLLVGQVAADRQLDVLGGAAGCALAMLALDRARPGAAALDVARACAERLERAAQVTEAGTAWPSAASAVPLAGYGHGASGIAVALLRLARLTEPEAAGRLRELARGALTYEGTLFDAASGTWRDLRPSAAGTAITAWCSGAAGIGLARLEAQRELGEPLERELAAALAATMERGFGLNHSLCHGDLGNLELLSEAGREAEEAYRQRLGRVCASLDLEGRICGMPDGLETPGLFAGLAGIGWQLLRFAEPARVPSLLTFDVPR